MCGSPRRAHKQQPPIGQQSEVIGIDEEQRVVQQVYENQGAAANGAGDEAARAGEGAACKAWI